MSPIPKLQFSDGSYHQLSINNWTGGMKDRPGKPGEHFLIYNMMVAEDGKLLPRGTVFELQCPVVIQTNATTPIDNIVNNVGGPMQGGGETPYHFFVRNHPSANQLELWRVNHTGLTQSFSAVGNTTNNAQNVPAVPAYCWAVDANGKPFFIFANWQGSGDDAQYQWDGTTFGRLSTTPPASQILVGFHNQSLFTGGGSTGIGNSVSLRNVLYWSTPNSLTSWPVINFTTVFSEKGLCLQDFVITSTRPIMTTNVSFLSVAGDPVNGFIPVEIGRVEDILLKGTLANHGQFTYVAGKNGVYIPSGESKDITLPIKTIYNPISFNFGLGNTNGKIGYGSFSTAGYFYAVYNQTPLPGTLIPKMPIPHTTNEQSVLLVYDTRFKCWYYWGYEFTIAGMCPMDPNPLNVVSSSNTFLTGFTFTGVSPTGLNALYFNQQSNTTGTDTIDGVTVNYKTGFVSGPINMDIPNGFKHIGGVDIIGTTQNEVIITIQSLNEDNEVTGILFEKTVTDFNDLINMDFDMKRMRICIAGDSTLVLEDIKIYYKVLDMVYA